MGDYGFFRLGLEGGHADETGLIAERQGELRLSHGLLGLAADTGDQGEVARRRAQFRRSRFGGKFEDGLEEVVLRVADLELGRVHADGESAGAGGEVVTRQGSLVLLGELPVTVERQRLGGDDVAGEEMSAEVH